MASSELRLSVERGVFPIISVAGELHYENCDQLRGLIRDTFIGPHTKLGLKLSGLEFVDSSGLRILVMAARDAAADGKTICMLSVTPQLIHLLDVSGFRSMFVISELPDPNASADSSGTFPKVGNLQFEIGAGISDCRDARTAVCDFAARMGFDNYAVDDIRLGVGEALSNAARHGAKSGATVQVCCTANNGLFTITLRYPSEVFDPKKVPVPVPESTPEGGMGIYFMRLVMDKVSYEFRDGFIILTMEKRACMDRESASDGKHLAEVKCVG